MEIGTATMENSIKIFKKLKLELPYDPAAPPLGMYPEKNSLKDTCTPMSLQHYLQ